MRLKRDEFKAMLKECILELVQEGKIFQNPAHAAAPQRVSAGAPQQQMMLGDEEVGEVTPNSRLNEAVKMTANLVAKGDPKKATMYQSLIADTARTTLQKQLSAQMTGAGNLMEGAALPEEREFDQAQLGMFEANNRWAQLAFGRKSKNGQNE